MPCDYSKYPPNWKTEIRPRILERADNKCEFCGLPNYSYVNKKTRELALQFEENSIRIILTIAHLDHDPENWNVKDSRLKALCQRCHLLYDRGNNEQKRRESITRNSKGSK